MRRLGAMVPASVTVCLALPFGAVTAVADAPAPQPGTPCATELSGVMTLLSDRHEYLMCQGEPGSWAEVDLPFPPNDKWLSFGPGITLHGEGMRNPNLESGQWTGTPRDPATTCTANQLTIVRAGVLAPPQVSQGAPGQPLPLQVQPRLFSIELAGDCLWSRTDGAG